MIYKLIAVATVGLAGSVALVAAGVSSVQGERPRTPPDYQLASAAPMRPHTGALPALPRVSYEPVRPWPQVQQAYEFAARHPEVLQYVPCYCGCERIGHTANHSCFVKSRAANGRVTEWDSHGIGCAICLQVGLDAMALYNQGVKPAAIRTAIDKKYASSFPSSTPTPRPSK
jgi:hypothetical protein